MQINKIEDWLYKDLQVAIKNYFKAWHRVPEDIDVENITIDRVRHIKEWGRGEDERAYIIEVSTWDNQYRELLSASEVGNTEEDFRLMLDEQNKNGLMLGKSIIEKQQWYEFPVIWGILDEVFDDEEYYEKDGKYGNEEYHGYGMKYEKEGGDSGG